METGLHADVGYIEKNVENSNLTLATFLDIEGTFNNVKLEAIHNALYGSCIYLILIE